MTTKITLNYKKLPLKQRKMQNKKYIFVFVDV